MGKSSCCLFCGSQDIDDDGWKTIGGTTGPQCTECGATGESVETWNDRSWLIDTISNAVDEAIRKASCGTYSEWSDLIEAIVSQKKVDNNGSV